MPRRRCVGCGRIAPKAELLRIALAPAGRPEPVHAVADPSARMSGRGAYLCRADGASSRPLESCLEQAERRGGIARALRRAIPGGLVLEGAKRLESVGP